VKHANLRANPRAALHLDDPTRAVIVEGSCDELRADDDLARRLTEPSRTKYGYAPDPKAYAGPGGWRLRPRRVLAWTRFPRDATRFLFPPEP
jgi:hypothetical protein